jgi:hypothetical protein
MRLHPLIATYNETTVLTDVEIQTALIAFKHACDYHFEPHWNATAGFLFVPKGSTKPTGPNVWELHFLDTSDQAGALGYHYDDNGMPVMRVFAKTDAQYGLSWQVTATHEIFEALGDAYCLLASQDPNANKFYGYEVGDPVEGDQFAYTYNGVKISDFILPAWFTGDPGPYDYAKHVSKPLQVLPDGYVSVYQNGAWTQYQQRGADLVATTADTDADRPRNRDRNARQLTAKARMIGARA